jgi:phage shock protein A
MFSKIKVEYRLAVLEEEVTDLKQEIIDLKQEIVDLKQKNIDRPATNWMDKLVGSITDEAAFLEALDYGRSVRQSDRPLDDIDEAG